MSRKFGESDLDRRTREAAFDRLVKRADEIVRRDKPEAAGPASAGETTDKFGTGAVRSKDAESERYDLISPIGLREVAEVYRTDFHGDGKEIFDRWEAFQEDCEPPAVYWLALARAETYAFLAGEGRRHLARATTFVLEAIAADAGEIRDWECVTDDSSNGWADIPESALKAIAETCQEGASKYSPFNWERGMNASDLLNHGLKHIRDWMADQGDEPNDLPHAGWNYLGAIHSVELWPGLNAGTLRGPGCTPPAADESAAEYPQVDFSLKGHASFVEVDRPDGAQPANFIKGPMESLMRTFDDLFGKTLAPGGDGASTPPSDPATAARAGLFDRPLSGSDNLSGPFFDSPGDSTPLGNGYTGLPVDVTPENVSSNTPGDPSDETPAPATVQIISDRTRALATTLGGEFPVVYLSGPMTGIPDYNFPAFNAAADALRRAGFPTVNPADFGADPAVSWADCLQRDLTVMGYTRLIVQLPGWEQSSGASLEFNVAQSLGKGVLSYSEALDLAELLAPVKPGGSRLRG